MFRATYRCFMIFFLNFKITTNLMNKVYTRNFYSLDSVNFKPYMSYITSLWLMIKNK